MDVRRIAPDRRRSSSRRRFGDPNVPPSVIGSRTILSEQLGDRAYCGGATFSIADATIFYTTRWAKLMKVALPANISALAAKVDAKPTFSEAVSTMV